MGGGRDLDEVAIAEAWFVRHGLPYFVDDIREGVAPALRWPRLGLVVFAAVVLGFAVAVLLVPVSWAVALGAGLSSLGAALALYAGISLHGGLVFWWAVRRTFRSLGLLLPIVTRALPLLLLFVTFLFINAEVWQVSANLDHGVLWLAVLLFAGIAIGFLLVRLPEELDSVDDEVHRDDLLGACRGTPLEHAAEAVAARVERVGDADAEVTGLQKANLVLVLLITQAVQVLLLSLSVFAFFIVFGVVVMEPGVVASWTGMPTHAVGGWTDRLSVELVRVSVFLAGFSGLYFTVYVVTDDLYRNEFFATVIEDLKRAVSARVAYRWLRDARSEAGSEAGE